MNKNWLWLIVVGSGILLSGCGGQGGASSAGGSGEEQVEEVSTSEIKRREVETLPEVDSYLPPLDEGRVRVAPPKGWRILSRDAKYLARFTKGEASSLPRIAVLAADSPSPEITNATEADMPALLELLTAKSKEGKKKPLEPVRPIILGDQLFARHVRLARYNDAPCAIVSLQTVKDGRLYTVELYVEAGSDGNDYPKFLKQDQDKAYAVAGNMKFGDEPASPMPTPETESPPAEPSAETPTTEP
jgi:hypothetical protein